MNKKLYDDNLLSEVIGDVLTYRDMGPEEGESWESWYYAAFDLLISRVHDTFERNKLPDIGAKGSLVFDPGILHVNNDGSGYIAVNEDDFVLVDDRCEGLDGPEGGVHWIARIDASEMVGIREFLKEVL